MKRILVFCLIIIAVLSISTCFAKVGDKVGNIYSTDIMTYINGVPVKSYNIGGRTCIAVEEVTMGHVYNNDYRMLLVTSFDPILLCENKETNSNTKIGKVVGSIYSTDIKTYFYDELVPSYNIGGKTCVAIEDIGNDNVFSNLGGKFIWNSKDRTLELEYLYDNDSALGDIQNEYNYGISIENGNVKFVPDIVHPAWRITDFSGVYNDLIDRGQNVIPLYYEDTIVGYNYCNNSFYLSYLDDENKAELEEMVYTFNYFYKDIIEEILINMDAPYLDRTMAIDQHIEGWLADIYDRYDTEDYSFLYLRQPTPYGTNALLLYVRNDGTYEYIHDMLPQTNTNTRIITTFDIDKEAEIAKFRVKNLNYIFTFDMKNCKLDCKEVEADSNTLLWGLN